MNLKHLKRKENNFVCRIKNNIGDFIQCLNIIFLFFIEILIFDHNSLVIGMLKNIVGIT